MRSPVALLMIAAGLLCAGPLDAAAGAHTPMGAVIDDPQLGSGETAAAVVLIFFRPDQHTFAGTMQSLAACEKELAGKSIRWLALAPSRFSAAEAKASAEAAGLRMPVLIDAGDGLQNTIGVAMHPTVAVLDRQHRLVQFQPFTKLNFCESVMARIRRVLGELDDAGLARALDPTAEPSSHNASAARRDLKLAEMLLKSGNLDKALEIAKTGATNDPSSAAAQSLIGRIFLARSDCRAATAAFDAALRLDANEPQAQAGKKACAGK